MNVAVRGLWHAISLLTIVPMPRLLPVDWEVQKWAVAWFPIVGGLLGSLSWVLVLVTHATVPALAPRLLAAGVVTLWAAITGGLHWDGFADVLDGWGVRLHGGERMLQVMRDPHIGSFGVLGLLLAVLLQWEAIAILLAEGRGQWLVTVPLAGRFAVTTLAAIGKPASTSGLGRQYIGNQGPIQLALAVTATLLLAWLVLDWQHGLVLLGIGVAVSAAVWRLARRLLGGLTGDVLGFTCVLTEMIYLVYLGSQ